MSNVELAREVGLSPSPCPRRVRLLEAAGIITLPLAPYALRR
jgi:DNA-binding Lrp family transcriptional regulator